MIEKPNMDFINELSGNDINFKKKLIHILKEEFPLEKQEYYVYLKDQKLKQTAEIVHKIKHKLNILGLKSSYKLALAHEKELLEGKRDFEEDFKKNLRKVESFLKIIRI